MKGEKGAFWFLTYVLGPMHLKILDYVLTNSENVPVVYVPYLLYSFLNGRNVSLYSLRNKSKREFRRNILKR